MATAKNKQMQQKTKSCPLKDGFFDNLSGQVVMTEDGSPTIRGPWGETYHSVSGAVLESQYVYVDNGLGYFMHLGILEGTIPSRMHILEMGLGTGLNALLTYRQMIHGTFPATDSIFYEAAELFPPAAKILEQLNYTASEEEDAFFRNMHRGPWNEPFCPAPGFTLLKRKENFVNYVPGKEIHVIYYDAFSPAVQPELWTGDIFEKIAPFLAQNAVLTTYCCRGSVRKSLKDAGFMTERLPGPGRKRHILRAVYGVQHLRITGVMDLKGSIALWKTPCE
jgi:tRNA U34 5-methylaminomethyl-2-thiouridine-forming methyltransferase MnmC